MLRSSAASLAWGVVGTAISTKSDSTCQKCAFLKIQLLHLQVVYQVGLVLAVWDITKIEENYVFPGDGSTHTIGLLLLIRFIR